MAKDDRILLQDIITGRHAEAAPSLNADSFFEIFSAEQILKARGYELDLDEVRAGIVGGGQDGGLDSFYVFANRKQLREDTDVSMFKGQRIEFDVILIQSKNSPSFEEAALLKIKDFIENCFRLSADRTPEVENMYKEALLTAVDGFHSLFRAVATERPLLSITVYYASLGDQVSPGITQRSAQVKATLDAAYGGSKNEVVLAGAKELFDWYRLEPTRTLILRVDRQLNCTTRGRSYVCTATLPDYFGFITDNGNLREYLFESNVRDYQGDVEVNNNIRQTLNADEGEEFWWLNNGVSIIAKQVVLSGNEFSITDPLIVNGLQTSYEIHHYFSVLSAESDDKRTVLVRIIETSDSASTDRIIKATNSQTKIPKLWLHSTEEIHRKIEFALQKSGLYYDRRKNFYKNQGKPQKSIIGMPYLAQALAAIVLQRPDDARARPTTVADKQYDSLFSERYPIDLYSKCALAQRRVDEFLDGLDASRYQRLNLTFYLSMYAVARALQSAKPDRRRIANLDISLLTDSLLMEVTQLVLGEYLELGGSDTVAKGVQLVSTLKSSLDQEFPRGN